VAAVAPQRFDICGQQMSRIDTGISNSAKVIKLMGFAIQRLAKMIHFSPHLTRN
jgi:hypothetical protein